MWLSIRLFGIFTYPACFWNQGVRIIEVLLYYQNFSNGHNFSSGDPISMIFWFSESLKGALSVGTFKSILFFDWFSSKWDGTVIFRKWEIWSCCKFESQAFHFKEFFLSFQKIRKLLKLEHFNKSYGHSKILQLVNESPDLPMQCSLHVSDQSHALLSLHLSLPVIHTSLIVLLLVRVSTIIKILGHFGILVGQIIQLRLVNSFLGSLQKNSSKFHKIIIISSSLDRPFERLQNTFETPYSH